MKEKKMTEEEKEAERKYHKRYYHSNQKYRENQLLYYKLKRIKKAVKSLRECIQVKKARTMGNSSCVLLPKDWEGRDVICIDNKFFMLQIFKSKRSET
jgi:putative transposon-encoded protein